MNRHQMIERLDGITDLPTLPIIAMEVNRMLQDVDAPIEKLTELLERDQSMAIKILRLVNSSFYGFKSQIATLRHAIALLGYNTIQHAVVTVNVIDCMKTRNKRNGFDISRFWSHSISVAIVSRFLAEKTRLAIPEEAFTAGLVHDIGKVVLVNHFPDQFDAIMESVAANALTFREAEKIHDVYPHHLIGSKLAENWLLPESLIMAVRYHHGKMISDDNGMLPSLVSISDTLVNKMKKEPGHHLCLDSIPMTIREPVVETLKKSPIWAPKIQEKIKLACEFFIKA